ncbi:Outer membrane cobalamin receptor protein, SusC/RagA family [Bacteroidales bacterium Barb6]|nr:Outer membrane cobalamin receptor protein, SusC/RagA family [Bacteroidales bacterium Barb6]
MREMCKTFSLRGLPVKIAKALFVAAVLFMNGVPALAQSGVKIRGVVTSAADGELLIGVNVVQAGATTNGTITDFDGKYELTVPAGAEVDFSYIGYLNQKIKAEAGKTEYNVSLREDSQSLDEVVVVGYGVQKKKLVTGATVQVGGDDLQKLSSTSALGALQSQTPGVNITQQSGKPGDGFKVTIRGLGTIGDSKPLYVIDGIAGGDINALNPSDIETIDVLKDAASAAIYGARAANGVILVTTKQGKSGKIQVTYDGFAGVQNVYKMPALLNAKEYMDILDKISASGNGGVSTYNWAENEVPAYLMKRINDGTWKGTNWLEESLNKNALTQNHAINLLGGSDVSKFSMGFSYSGQEGIIGKQIDPSYERYTARINSDHVLLKGKGFDAVKIGENVTFSHRSNHNSVSTGNRFSSTVGSLIKTSPLIPMYNADGGWYDQTDKERDGSWKSFQQIGNPLALLSLTGSGNNFSRNYSLNASAYLEIQPVKDLKYRSVFGYKQTAYQSRSYDAAYNLSLNDKRPTDYVTQSGDAGYSVTWDNTISYSFKVAQQHSFDAVLGQSIEKWGMGQSMESKVANSIFPGSFDHAYIINAKPSSLTDVTTITGAPWDSGALASFFGRVNYNFKETYMASAVLRADGSSNFASGHRWGYFPSLSAGWVITNEDFMEPARNNGLDFLKIRASWGQNGNASISNYQYLATIAMDDKNSYYFGDSKESPTTGAYADILPNPDVSWETSEQLDLGLDARVLNSRLGINFDWYSKTTKDWLVQAPQLATFGTGAPYINGGDIKNSGVELGLNWSDKAGDFTYGANFNVSYNKNEVTRIANSEGIIHGPADVLSQQTTEMFRVEVGKPAGFFWGYKTNGIFQNQAQIDAHRSASNGVVDENVQSGDVIFVDTNKDGSITDADKVMIGNPHPDFTGGLSLSLGYKGIDLAVTAYGAFGMQIAKSYRSFMDYPEQNYTSEVFNYWHGEGTSNTSPRLTIGTHSNKANISDLYVENADYVKISNITLGYDLKKLCPKLPFGQTRLYVTAQNLFTFTGYSGMDPEVGYNYSDNDGDYTWSSGIDLGFYPSARTYLIGLNLKF